MSRKILKKYTKGLSLKDKSKQKKCCCKKSKDKKC